MRLLHFLKKSAISIRLTATAKDEAIREMVGLLADQLGGASVQDAVGAVLERERLGSTAVGHGVAIPHGKVQGVQHMLSAFAIAPHGIDFDSANGESVNFIYLLLSPQTCIGLHLQALAKVSRLFRSDAFVSRLNAANSVDEVYKILEEVDSPPVHIA
ncbi:PTS sugar transporter subunit IIA [bacterium]|nr:PTS sugar transporter subunit IIA [candidate division CSSED10-310 bacterium]